MFSMSSQKIKCGLLKENVHPYDTFYDTMWHFHYQSLMKFELLVNEKQETKTLKGIAALAYVIRQQFSLTKRILPSNSVNKCVILYLH